MAKKIFKVALKIRMGLVSGNTGIILRLTKYIYTSLTGLNWLVGFLPTHQQIMNAIGLGLLVGFF